MLDDLQTFEITLNTVTEEIAIRETEIVASNRELRELEQAFAERRSFIEYSIVSDKVTYSNDIARKAAVIRSLSSDDEAKKLQQRINQLTTESAMLQAERDDASRRRQNLLGILSYHTSVNYGTAPVLTGGIR